MTVMITTVYRERVAYAESPVGEVWLPHGDRTVYHNCFSEVEAQAVIDGALSRNMVGEQYKYYFDTSVRKNTF